MTSPIIDFIEARLAEDEAVAHAASQGPWKVDDPTYAEAIMGPDGYSVVSGGRWGDEAPVFETTEDALHIARHDPARVLREVQAKRRILKEHSTPHTVVDGFCTECGSDLQGGVHKRDRSYCEIHGWRECETVLALAAIYSDHPDYRKEWAA